MNTYRRPHIAGILLASALSACMLASCSDALLAQLNDLIRDANTPTISPPAGTVITAHETLTLVFPSALTPSAVAVSGNLGASYDSATWSDEKTLALNPGNAVAWEAGAERTLRISLTENGETATYDFTFEVFDGVCVGDPSIPASSFDTGTCMNPYRTIDEGITTCYSQYFSAYQKSAVTRVGAYSYTVLCTNQSFVANLAPGVSMIGGYSADFSERVPGDRSTLVDSSTSDTASTITDPVRVINIEDTQATLTTIVRGFTIMMGSGGAASTARCGIYCSGASPSIDDIAIVGSTGTSERTIGVYLLSSSAIIDACTIYPGTSSIESRGVYIKKASSPAVNPTLSNSTITGGKSADTYGIYTEGYSAPIIDGNSIQGGEWTANGYCIVIDTPVSGSVITDNVLSIYSLKESTFGIFEAGPNSDPVTLTGNDFNYQGPNWYFDEGSTAIGDSNYGRQVLNNGSGDVYLFNIPWGNHSTSANLP